MSNKIFVIAGLMIMVTAFSGCDLLGGDKNQEGTKEGINVAQNQENQENIESDNNKEEAVFCSMRDLMNRNESLKCSYEYTAEYIKEEGLLEEAVFYVADNKARDEIEITDKTTKIVATRVSIILEDWVYVQHSLLPWNLKIHVNDLQDEVYDQDEGLNLDEKKNFKCQSWTFDNSKFVLPTGIKFEDLTQAFRDHQEENPVEELEAETKKGLCDICREYSNKEKEDECLAKYKCE